MTFFIAEKTIGAKIHIWNVSESNFWRCQDEISVGLFFFCRTIDPLFSSTPFPLFFPLLISSPLLFSTLVSPLLFPLRGKLQMTLFPLPFRFLCFLCCNVFSNISCRHGRRLDDWRENRETEGCHEEGNEEKSEHLSDGEGGGCFGNPSWT